MIEVENLSKTFRIHRKDPGLKASIRSLFHRDWVEKPALRSVSFQVRPGEIVGLVGPNGAGKTTLVKALAGILHPTSGTAKVLGFTPWERKNAFRRQIALLMGQKAQLWWDLPAADCFLLLREIYEVPAAEHRETLSFLAEALKVSEQLTIPIRRLSLGERMKMELIAALLHHPQVVFLDEPTIGLDFAAQNAIRGFILDYRKQYSPAMILTSHYMEDIVRLCERIIIIREGEFIYDGPLQKIVRDYALHKVVTVHWGPEKPPPNSVFLRQLGEVLVESPEMVRLKVRRERVTEVTGAMMHHGAVQDLNIQEEEIGSLIESLMKNGRKKASNA